MGAGVRLVWLVDPRAQTVEELRPDPDEPRGGTHSRLLSAEVGDVLEAEDVLPGFRLSVADVFA
jgi:Uma2 family endonuclease